MKTTILWNLGFILQFTFAYLDNNIIRIVSSVGPCSCKLECFSSSDCASVYYDWQHFNCELSSSNESLTEFNASSSYHFSSMDDIKEVRIIFLFKIRKFFAIKTFKGKSFILKERYNLILQL